MDDRFCYDEIMRGREENPHSNRCPILNKEFRDRLCPSDGVSQCPDCPFKEDFNKDEPEEDLDGEIYW